MSGRFFKKNNASTVVQKLTLKAVLEYRLVEKGDKILIAASGGKDSTVLAYALSSIRYALKIDNTLCALHISSDFCNCCKKGALKSNLDLWKIPFYDLFVPVIGRLKPSEKMNCYWCSTQRRTELIKYAVQNGFNKIALGHHLDDIIETFFMNINSCGKLSGMPVRLVYNKYPVTLIRPLALLEERQIISCAAENGILKSACTCPYGQKSKRSEMRERIAEFTAGSSAVKRRIYKAFMKEH